MSTIEDAKITKTAYTQDLLQRKNVTGTAVGEKLVDGKPTGEPAILVFVQKKYSESNVLRKFSADELVPQSLDGIPTDVIEVGVIQKQSFKTRMRPLKPGYSVGHGDVTCGTIGGFFYDKDNEPVVLSNNHVLANENRAKVGDIIYQPGIADARVSKEFLGWTEPVSQYPYIGTLKDYIQLGPHNTHDSAIMRIPDALINSNLVDPIYPTVNRAISGIGDPALNMQVQKCGRTTGYTTGRIIGLHATFTIEYDFGMATFHECVVMTNMSQGGDSGSVILDMDMRAVALLFAGSPKVTLANPMSIVSNHYGLRIWNGPEVKSINNGSDWRVFTTDGNAKFEDGILRIEENSNQHCFVERTPGTFRGITCTVNTGSDTGASWGPGVVVQWPNGFLKVNLRHGDKFCGAFNTNESMAIGSVKPNTDYTLRIRKTQNSYVGEVLDDGRWFVVIEVPTSVFPLQPVAVRLGKTGLTGSTTDFAPSSTTEAGGMGVCTIKDIKFE